MPGEPKKTSLVKETREGQRRHTEYVVEENNRSYGFSITEHAILPQYPDKDLEALRDELINAFRGQLLSSKSFDVKGNPGIEIAYRGIVPASSNRNETQIVAYTRIIMVRNYVVNLSIVAALNAVDQDAANRYWEKFSIADQGQSP